MSAKNDVIEKGNPNANANPTNNFHLEEIRQNMNDAKWKKVYEKEF